MPTLPEHARRGHSAQILGHQCAHFVTGRIVQMKHAEITVRFVENGFAVRLAARAVLAPEHGDFLLRVSFDDRHAHPDVRGSGSRIPAVDLIGQRLAFDSKTKILSLRLRLCEIEPVLVQSN